MEKIRDLLDVSKNDLKIRENKQGCFIENLTENYVSDKHELFRIITYGQKNRVTCATNMNEHSSRSHLIFLLSVNQFNNLESSSKTSKLFLIDLAGSEKISKTGAEGKVLEEAKKINLSLTNLGKVIKALS
jgi:kinesin family member 5